MAGAARRQTRLPMGSPAPQARWCCQKKRADRVTSVARCVKQKLPVLRDQNETNAPTLATQALFSSPSWFVDHIGVPSASSRRFGVSWS